MFWITFLVMAVVFYAPPLNLGHYLLQKAESAGFRVPLVGWPLPGWLVFLLGVTAVYMITAWVSFLLTQTFFSNNLPGRVARRMSAAGLGGIETLMPLLAILVIASRFVILPIYNLVYKTAYHVSADNVILALLMLFADALRIVENTAWEDFDYKMRCIEELRQQGYAR